MVERKVFGEASAVGRGVKDPFDEEGPTYIVKGVLEDIKRFDNRLPQGAAFFAIRPSVEEIPEMNYFIRIDPAAPFLAGEYPDMDTAGYRHPARRLAPRQQGRRDGAGRGAAV